MISKEKIVLSNSRISVLEGLLYAIMVGFGESLLIPWALLLGFRASQIAILATLPIALGSLNQFLTPWLHQFIGHRKLMISLLMFVQAAGLFFLSQLKNPTLSHILTGSIIYWTAGSGVQPLWASWMIPQNPSQKISLYHARRNALITLVTAITFIGAGAILFQRKSPEFFQMLFFLGFFSRTLGGVLIFFHYDEKKQKLGKSLIQLPQEGPLKPNRTFLVLLVLVLIFFRAGAGLASPHFAQYMLEDLKLNYLHYSLIIGCGYFGRAALLESWILTSHRFGSRLTFLVGSMVISILPMLWLLHDSVLYLMGLEIVAGGAWAAFELLTLLILASMGFSTWNRYLGLMGMFATLGALGCGYLGGRMLEMGYPMIYIFGLSTLLRSIGAILLLSLFYRFVKEEIRPRNFIPLFFSTLSLRPSFSNISWVFWVRRKSKKEISPGKSKDKSNSP